MSELEKLQQLVEQIEARPIFEVFHRDGRCCRVWLNGRIEGFPEGFDIIANHASVAVMALSGFSCRLLNENR